MIDKKLQAIGLKEDETKTFIYLVENPGQTAGVIAKKTGLSRPSLYGYLKNLQEKGLIIESQKDGVKTFSAASQDKISIVFDEHIKELENAKHAVAEAFTEIQKGNKPIATPRLQLFEGRKEMQHITKELLLYKNINAKSYWPIKLMLEVLGEDFFKEFNKERIKRGITIEAIWPQSQIIDMDKYPFMGSGGDFLRETRVAPKEIDFRMGYWIYENKVSFISSSKDNFGFIIESQEFVDMLTSQFDVMWKLSKTIEVSDEKSKEWFAKMYK